MNKIVKKQKYICKYVTNLCDSFFNSFFFVNFLNISYNYHNMKLPKMTENTSNNLGNFQGKFINVFTKDLQNISSG